MIRKAVDGLHQARRPFFELLGIGFLVETLLVRGADGDLAEAPEAIERLAQLGAPQDWAMREVTLLRLRALVARARGHHDACRDLVARYFAMAKSLGFEGHLARAETMSAVPG